MFPQLFPRMPTRGKIVEVAKFASQEADNFFQRIQELVLPLSLDIGFWDNSLFAHPRSDVFLLSRSSLYTHCYVYTDLPRFRNLSSLHEDLIMG